MHGKVDSFNIVDYNKNGNKCDDKNDDSGQSKVDIDAGCNNGKSNNSLNDESDDCEWLATPPRAQANVLQLCLLPLSNYTLYESFVHTLDENGDIFETACLV